MVCVCTCVHACMCGCVCKKYITTTYIHLYVLIAISYHYPLEDEAKKEHVHYHCPTLFRRAFILTDQTTTFSHYFQIVGASQSCKLKSDQPYYLNPFKVITVLCSYFNSKSKPIDHSLQSNMLIYDKQMVKHQSCLALHQGSLIGLSLYLPFSNVHPSNPPSHFSSDYPLPLPSTLNIYSHS